MNTNAIKRNRIYRATNYVQNNFFENIHLSSLADKVHISKFHFARDFHNLIGESPYAYISRTRLEYAARSLAFDPDRRITNIALDSGFATSQSFSRAFTKYFKNSPKNFRANNIGTIQTGTPDASVHPSKNRPILLERSTFENSSVTVEFRPNYRVAYIRHLGPYFENGSYICEAFEKIKSWAQLKNLWLKSNSIIGLCPSSPELTPANLCIYDICFAVPNTICEDNEVSIQTIPGGTYATLKVRLREYDVEVGWKWLVEHWLPSTNFSYAMHSSYEHYHLGPSGRLDSDTQVELCMRINNPTEGHL